MANELIVQNFLANRGYRNAVCFGFCTLGLRIEVPQVAYFIAPAIEANGGFSARDVEVDYIPTDGKCTGVLYNRDFRVTTRR
jgi:hypothetical protein